ncbi:MAG: hypothetical protein AB2805_18305 [Candidatus Thiodiazotropha sp.]
MNATLLNILLAATGLGTLAWIVWQKKNGRPWLAKWLMAIALLALPIVLTKFLGPAAWTDIQTMPVLIKYLAAVPLLMAVAVLCGGLLVALASAVGLFVNSLDQVEWKSRGNDETTYGQSEGYFDWPSRWYSEIPDNKYLGHYQFIFYDDDEDDD